MILSINEYKTYIFENSFKLFETLNTINESTTWDDSIDIPKIQNDINDDIKQLKGISGLKTVVNDKVKQYVNSALDKINKLSDKKKIVLFKILMSSFFALISLPQMISTIHSWGTKNNVPTEIVQQYDNEIKNIYKKKINTPTTYSNALVNFIKKQEKLELKAYDIHDGKITVGYGHAVDAGGKLKVGTVITEKQADQYLKKDLKEAKDGLNRILKDWKKNGITVEITQGQYDAMVSMIFNSGIGHFRLSNFIQEVKNNNIDKAQQEINNLNSEQFYNKFPGVKTRRELEAKMFATNAQDVVNELT